MTVFWIIAAALIVLTLVICIRAIHADKNIKNELIVDDISLLQQRMDELNNDLENGTLTTEEAENSRKEIQLAMLNRRQQGESLTAISSKFNRMTSVLLLAFIPVFVLLLYSYIGRPDLIVATPLQAQQDMPPTPEQIEQMVVGLEQRLRNNPDDVDGWLMFYRSNMVLEKYSKAVLAAEKLYELQGEQVEVLLRYADALAMANNQELAGKPTQLILRILEIEPDNASAIWLAGMAASERGDYQQALDYWEGLLPRIEDGTESQQQMQEMIAFAKQQLGQDAAAVSTTADSAADQIAITINVYLSPELTDTYGEDATLFVYARSEDGNPMPIAVVRESINGFPVQITLDNSNFMMPQRKLADFESVQLIARISNSGQAKPENGDLIGAASNISPRVSDPIDLVIRDKIAL